jgi:DNA-binding IclR family transcriptional regulator
MRDKGKGLTSVSRALQVLKLFDSSSSLRVTDVGEKLRVGRSSAHRLLTTLRAEGFLVQDPESRAYQLGPAMLRLGLAAVDALDLRGVSHDVLKQLSLRVEETISLMVLEGDKVRFVDAIDSPRRVRVYSRTGDILPAHCTSGGKAILAELALNELRALYPRKKLLAATPRSITSWPELVRELETVRQRGYALNQGESTSYVTAVGVAIHDVRGRAIGALCISAVPTPRLTTARITEFVTEARRAAAEIETLLARSQLSERPRRHAAAIRTPES